MGGWSGSDDAESTAALERSIELGCTFFDTALVYGNGKSEQLLAPVLARHRDKKLVVATKIPPKNMKWPGLPTTPVEDAFPPDHIRQSTETSLRNLGVASVDLQQFHVWSDAWAGDDKWKRAIDDLKSEGAHPRLRHQRQSMAARQRPQGALNRRGRLRPGRLQRVRSESRRRIVPPLPGARHRRDRARAL
jgi:aryl-alcohol dehydrogenase-like predicted oxidoreductase